MIDGAQPDGVSTTPWSFDIAQQTVAPVDLGGWRGLIVDIGDRVGFLRRGDEAWFGDKVREGEAQPLDKAVEEFELQRQLQKLQVQTSDVGAGLPVTGWRPMMRSTTTTSQPTVPGLDGLPVDAEVHVVGVYEGKDAARAAHEHAGNVQIVLRRTGHPIVLVLASYEAVNWSVANAGGHIAAVLLSGYKPSTVNGIGDARVLRIGSAYAYAGGGPDYERLRQEILQYVGAHAIRSFQGVYSGTEFAVGGR